MKMEPESGIVEHKRSVGEWREIVETCAAFATAQGGRILIGVDPDGTVCGQRIGKDTLEDLANKIAQQTNPRQTPCISMLSEAGRSLVLVDVPESPVKPVYAFDRPYRRCGRTNQRLSPEEAMHLFLDSRGRTWDQTILEEATLDDIDPASVQRFLRVAQTERRWDVRGDAPVGPVLRQLGLIQQGRLTIAAVLLFGRNPQRLMTQAMVRCARFKGTTEVHFLDMQVIQGNIIDQVEQALTFAKRNIRMGAEIKGLRREDVWEYPVDGLREALVNAVCHRDYASTANVQVRIFDDRLEVWNPGELPDGMTVEDLRGPHESRPRNKLVANAFFLIKYVEQFGTGIQRILDDCHAHELPEPEFEVHARTFRAVFKPGAVPGDAAVLSERETMALERVRAHGRITRAEYEQLTGVSYRTAVREINGLVRKGILRRLGGGRRYWYEENVDGG